MNPTLQILSCKVCQNDKAGIHTKHMKHTCFKSDRYYKTPETRKNKFGDVIYKIFITRKLMENKQASKWVLPLQIINGYKPIPRTELWIPDVDLICSELAYNKKHVWVRESFYKNLAFV